MTCEEILAAIDVLRASNDVYEAAKYAAQLVIDANNRQIAYLQMNYAEQGCGPISSSSLSSMSSSSWSSGSSFSSGGG